jgi:hypothetical protein
MALLRIQRPEGLKEQVPAELGMLVGLDLTFRTSAGQFA